MSIVFDHCVKDHQQLSHAGGMHDFERLTFGFEAFGELSDDGVASPGREGSHVQSTSDRSPTSPDRTLATETTTIAVERSQAGQRRHLLAVEVAQFREGRQKGGDGFLADSRNVTELFHFALPLVVRFDHGKDVLIDLFDLFVQQVDDLLNTLSHRLDGDGVKSVAFGGSEIDELAATYDDLFEFCLFFRRFVDSSRPYVLAKACNHFCVDTVGFREYAQSFGKVADLPRVDHSYVMSGIEEFSNQTSLVSTRCLDYNKASSLVGQLAKQLRKSLLVIRERQSTSFWETTNIKRSLGDIDTDELCNRLAHGIVPSLRIRARDGMNSVTALAAVRALSKKPATIQLCDGLRRPGHDRSVTGRRGKACFAALRRLSHGCLYYTLCL